MCALSSLKVELAHTEQEVGELTGLPGAETAKIQSLEKQIDELKTAYAEIEQAFIEKTKVAERAAAKAAALQKEIDGACTEQRQVTLTATMPLKGRSIHVSMPLKACSIQVYFAVNV